MQSRIVCIAGIFVASLLFVSPLNGASKKSKLGTPGTDDGPQLVTLETQAAVRFPVAHQHAASGCFGYLYFSRGIIRFEVLHPDKDKSHSFQYSLSDLVGVKEYTVLGVPIGAELKFRDGRTYHFYRVRRNLVEDLSQNKLKWDDVLSYTPLVEAAKNPDALLSQVQANNTQPAAGPKTLVSSAAPTTTNIPPSQPNETSPSAHSPAPQEVAAQGPQEKVKDAYALTPERQVESTASKISSRSGNVFFDTGGGWGYLISYTTYKGSPALRFTVRIGGLKDPNILYNWSPAHAVYAVGNLYCTADRIAFRPLIGSGDLSFDYAPSELSISDSAVLDPNHPAPLFPHRMHKTFDGFVAQRRAVESEDLRKSDLAVQGRDFQSYVPEDAANVQALRWVNSIFHLALSNFSAAAAELNETPTPWQEVNAGDAAFSHRNLQQAIQHYNAALQALPKGSAPDIEKTLLERASRVTAQLDEEAGDAALRQRKAAEAIQDYERALQILPRDVVSDPLNQELQRKITTATLQVVSRAEEAGDAAAKNGNLTEAIRDYKDALQKVPSDAPPNVRPNLLDKITSASLRPSAQEESVGDAAAKGGQATEALQHYITAFHELPESPPPEAQEGLLKKIADVGSQVKPAPAIPEEAHKHMVMGTTILRAAKSPEDFKGAIGEFQKAVRSAPWWGDAYYNLGVAEEAAGEFGEAKRHLQLYLASKPPTADARSAQDKIYEIDAKARLAAENPASSTASSTSAVEVSEADIERKVAQDEQTLINGLSGSWYCQTNCRTASVSVSNGIFTATIIGNVAEPDQFCAYNDSGDCGTSLTANFSGSISGFGIRGTVSLPRMHVKPTNCDTTSVSKSFTGSIEQNGKSISLNFGTPGWETHAHPTILGPKCYSVDADGDIPTFIGLTR
jgi:tetratricopeptide (TPR) repeat protein